MEKIKKRRDMTSRQFKNACDRRGITIYWDCVFGYCKMKSPNIRLVSRFNGGETFREQLAYLIKKQTKIDNERKVNDEKT